MKKIFNYIFFFLVFINLSCAQTIGNRVYFSIDPEDRKILLPAELQDSITGNFCFDTFYSSVLDSSFCAAHPSLSFYNDTTNVEQSIGGSFFATTGARILLREGLQSIKIGKVVQTYKYTQISDLKGYYYNDKLDGVFNIPLNDTINVWELNFDHNYIEIHPANKFSMPKDCILFPMAEDVAGDKDGGRNAIKIRLPIKIQCSDGDTLTMNRIFYIDTGIPCDLALMHKTEEIDFFNNKADAVWTKDSGGYNRHYNVKATLLDNYTLDSLRIYTFDRPTGIGDKCLIGINFLKRFNVFFDMKNKQVGLQPVMNYERIVDPLYRRYHYSVTPLMNGNMKITHIADYNANYYKNAGLHVGDEILAIDGKLCKDISFEERQEFHTRDTLVFDILREGEILKITVVVDKNEIQGD